MNVTVLVNNIFSLRTPNDASCSICYKHGVRGNLVLMGFPWIGYTENGDKSAGFPKEKVPFCHRFKYIIRHVVAARLRKNTTEKTPGMLAHTLTYFGSLTIPDRPGRFEPRVIKRRLYRYPLKKKPRHVLKISQRKKLS